MSRITHNIISYAKHRKRQNPDISCRFLASEINNKFKIKISKSSINAILKTEKLSSPIGRRVSQGFSRTSAEEIKGAGYVFLLGANILLGLSKIIASAIKKANPGIRLRLDALEAISEAWIMAKAMYNVPLEKIENYSKNDLWFILGRGVNKGLLKEYRKTMENMQPIGNQMVTEISAKLQDVICLRATLADGTCYALDGQLKTVWRDKKIPVNFCITIDIARSYIKNYFSGKDPVVVFNIRPEMMLGEEAADFILSMDGAVSAKRIRKIEIVSLDGKTIAEESFLVPKRRNFMIGVWPQQFKPMEDLAKKPFQSRFFLEGMGTDFYFLEDNANLSQLIHNNEVTLRLIILKNTSNGPAKIGILTNLDKKEWDSQRVVETYLKHFPDIDTSYQLFLSISKAPSYLEEIVASAKVSAEVNKLKESCSPDALVMILVEILHQFSKKMFFPSACSGWSLLKMRELFYKQAGLIKRDLAEDILYNLFDYNKLEEINYLTHAAVRFNELPIYDFSGRKVWIKTS